MSSKKRFICEHIFINKETERFIRHNKKIWPAWKIKNCKSEILVDFYAVRETLIAYSYFLNVLARKHNACIKAFPMTNPFNNQRLYIFYHFFNVFFKIFSSNNLYSNPALSKVYQSFNSSGYIVPTLDQEQKMRQREICQKIKQNIKTNRDVFEISIMGVWMGIDIYESYLIYFNKPTVYLDDPELFDLIDKSVELLIFWTDYIEKHKVAAVVVSHDCYIPLDIICKIAYQKKIPVYLPNIRGISLSDSPHSLYSSRFINYRKMFRSLPPGEQANGIKLAKEQLQRRFQGEVGVDMPYSTKSAFRESSDDRPILRKSDKIKVLICTHCFYDNPHAYGGMLFVDFYEWLHFLGKISEKTDYDWYLKMHPDPLPGTEEIIREIIAKYPRITFIPPETSFLKLAKEGLNFALTVYGSVGHELPALGIQVINAGYNPHVAYDFNWNPKTTEEYEYFLLNLEKLHKNVSLQELYEFYYMHYYYVLSDDLILKSYKQSIKDLDLKEQIGPEIYEYFLNQLTEAKHQKIIEKMQKFIDSGKHNYFSRGPE